jgi:hypothetical protein
MDILSISDFEVTKAERSGKRALRTADSAASITKAMR